MTARPEGDFDDVIAFAWGGPAGSVADAARLLLLDSLGCMIAGLGHATPRRFADALAITMPGTVYLPGCAAGLSEAGAAAVLAAAMCWDEANEGLARAHGRPALAVAPLCIAALAAGRVAPGAAHAAFALGYEIAGRAGEIWRIRPGMHVDGSWHTLGAAAAAARLAGGDAAEVARAIRLAACQIPFALYASIAAGMDGRNSYPAHAVLLGAMAAAAARAGMDAPADGLAEARRIALLHDAPATRAPAGEWLIEQAYIKPFADPALHRLEDLVELAEDTALTTAEKRGARLIVTLASGESHRASVGAIAGDPGHALDEAAVMAKCQRVAAPVIGDAAMARLAAMILGADGATPHGFFQGT